MLQGDLPDSQPHQQAAQEELGEAQEDTVLHTRHYSWQVLARNSPLCDHDQHPGVPERRPGRMVTSADAS